MTSRSLLRRFHPAEAVLLALLLAFPVFAAPKDSSPAAAAAADSCPNPSGCISVDFDQARLSEVAMLVSEYTGTGFVFNEGEGSPAVSWSQQNIRKDDLVPAFIKVLTSLGCTVHRIEGASGFWAILQQSSLVASVSDTSTGVYQLRNVSAQSVQKSAAALYGGRLSVAAYKNKYSSGGGNEGEDSGSVGGVVAFTGTPDLVNDFASLLSQVDQLSADDSGIASVRLKYISVRTALKAVQDLKIFDGKKSAVFPDYWNRSVIVRGAKEQQDITLLALSAIDKPQQGYVDEVVFVQTIPADQALAMLQDMYESLAVRKIADDRLLISGEEKLVDKALAVATRMDGTGLQVKVEAVVAQLTDREFRELGIKLASNRSDLAVSFNDKLSSVVLSASPGTLIDYFDGMFTASLSATDTKAHGSVLSSPVLTVLNGQEANIVVGQNVPFLGKASASKKDKEKDKDDDSDESADVERRDVGLTFKVRPVIRPDGDFITLTISQELSSVNPDSQLSSAVDLIVDKKSLSTTVLAGNGDTIFLGGLRADERGKSFDTVPLLGDLPLIGPLFAYEAKTTEIRHLVISLRVNVMAAPQPGAAASNGR